MSFRRGPIHWRATVCWRRHLPAQISASPLPWSSDADAQWCRCHQSAKRTGFWATTPLGPTAKHRALGQIICAARNTLSHSLRRSFTQLCHDDTPMVRRAASANLGKLATAMHQAGEAALLKAVRLAATLLFYATPAADCGIHMLVFIYIYAYLYIYLAF